MFVLRDQFEENVDKPSSAAFGNKELSVYVEGDGFQKMNLKDELIDFRNKTGKDFVGVVSLSAGVLQNREDFRFEVVHDPYPYNNRDGELIQQHSNHALVVCDKDPTGKRSELQKMSDWSLHPRDCIDLK